MKGGGRVTKGDRRNEKKDKGSIKEYGERGRGREGGQERERGMMEWRLCGEKE